MKTKKRILLIIESSTSYGRGIVKGIARYAQERNEWWIDIENRGIHEPTPSELKNWNGDGIIGRIYTRETIDLASKSGCPFINLMSSDLEALTIRVDEHEVARMALEHFLENGLNRFGFYAFGKCRWLENRSCVFDRAVQKKGFHCYLCPTPVNEQFTAEPIWKNEYEKLLFDWLPTLPRPIGIFTGNDSHAIRLVSVCRKLDIAIPEEIAVLGINDDQHLCEALTPTLSSMDLNSERIGYEAARLLDKSMNGKRQPKHPIVLPPLRIVRRQSTDMLAIENDIVVDALRFIREYATQGISVHHVLDAIHVSVKTLERGFHKFVGRTPEKEIIRVRINHAINLLQESQLSIDEIAQLSGFGSKRYFQQIFRRERGETPSQFRNRK